MWKWDNPSRHQVITNLGNFNQGQVDNDQVQGSTSQPQVELDLGQVELVFGQFCAHGALNNSQTIVIQYSPTQSVKPVAPSTIEDGPI